MVRLIACTKGCGELSDWKSEDLVAYVARVSNPTNQMNAESAPKLLRYLLKNKHFSPYEHVSVTLEIATSRGIAAQILRHRSFVFQEFSQRYAECNEQVRYEARRQDVKNRQNSIDDMSVADKEWFAESQSKAWDLCSQLYKDALARGIAKEQARFMLPIGTKTTLFMTGSLRSWIHYIEVRTDPSAQKEHRDIALLCKEILKAEYPSLSEALSW